MRLLFQNRPFVDFERVNARKGGQTGGSRCVYSFKMLLVFVVLRGRQSERSASVVAIKYRLKYRLENVPVPGFEPGTFGLRGILDPGTFGLRVILGPAWAHLERILSAP